MMNYIDGIHHDLVRCAEPKLPAKTTYSQVRVTGKVPLAVPGVMSSPVATYAALMLSVALY